MKDLEIMSLQNPTKCGSISNVGKIGIILILCRIFIVFGINQELRFLDSFIHPLFMTAGQVESLYRGSHPMPWISCIGLYYLFIQNFNVMDSS